mmetsp:Transcript_22654/g.56251  ORF Transcript_22654/g.56251 Transcript_22654/m.56251 type:complete len:220 (+) Transcript_22654:172-831(+)
MLAARQAPPYVGGSSRCNCAFTELIHAAYYHASPDTAHLHVALCEAMLAKEVVDHQPSWICCIPQREFPTESHMPTSWPKMFTQRSFGGTLRASPRYTSSLLVPAVSGHVPQLLGQVFFMYKGFFSHSPFFAQTSQPSTWSSQPAVSGADDGVDDGLGCSSPFRLKPLLASKASMSAISGPELPLIFVRSMRSFSTSPSYTTRSGLCPGMNLTSRLSYL